MMIYAAEILKEEGREITGEHQEERVSLIERKRCALRRKEGEDSVIRSISVDFPVFLQKPWIAEILEDPAHTFQLMRRGQECTGRELHPVYSYELLRWKGERWTASFEFEVRVESFAVWAEKSTVTKMRTQLGTIRLADAL
jgi:hypothetical protein